MQSYLKTHANYLNAIYKKLQRWMDTQPITWKKTKTEFTQRLVATTLNNTQLICAFL